LIGEALSSRMTAAHAVTTTDDRKGPVTTADGETATTATTDAAAALEILTPAAESLGYHAVLSDEMTATVTEKPLVPGLATTAAAAITHVQEAPRPSIATYHAANGATTATASAQTVEIAKEMTAEIASGMIVGAPATTAASVRAASVPENTTAGTRETVARARVVTVEIPVTQSEGAGSRTPTATCPVVAGIRTVKLTKSGMIRSEIRRGAEVEIETEIESRTGTVMIVTETTAALRMTATEIPGGVAADRGVGTVVAGDVVSKALQMHRTVQARACIVTSTYSFD
jgi:hypothetical protein